MIPNDNVVARSKNLPLPEIIIFREIAVVGIVKKPNIFRKYPN